MWDEFYHYRNAWYIFFLFKYFRIRTFIKYFLTTFPNGAI